MTNEASDPTTSPARRASSPARGDSTTQDCIKSSTSTSSSSSTSSRQLGVLGIGLIIEEVGKGARLVFRYPASPPPCFLPIPYPDHDGMVETIVHGTENNILRVQNSPNTSPNKRTDQTATTSKSSDSTTHHGSSGSIDLFFDLKSRVFSKLFRPKRALCGQPLTLNVSGTTFCCRAELFDSQQPSSIGEGSDRPLVLFSLVVALAPMASTPHQSAQQQPHFSSNVDSVNDYHHSDDALSTTQSVHRNLARLCRVFKREELRCRYVSRQCNMLLQIQKEYEARIGHEITRFASGSGDNVGVGTSNSSTAGIDVNPKITDASLSSKESRTSIPPPTSSSVNGVQESKKSKVSVADNNTTSRPVMTQSQRREHDLDLIEIMLAASPPTNINAKDDDFGGKDQHGNLARELARVFHLLSSPSASILPNAKFHEGIVYINRHIAVPLDSVNVNFVASSQSHNHYPKHIQPYHTLLFPTSSPTEVLESLLDESIGGNEMPTSRSISHSLRRILPHVQPNKSIHETAWEAALALPHVMSAARWLVRTGLCVAAMPVLRKNRYVCAEGVVARMATMAMPFWQTFGVRSRSCAFFWEDSASSSHIRQNDDIVDDAMHRKSTRTVTAGVPHLFFLVSALTTKLDDRSAAEQNRKRSASPTLEEAMHLLSGYGGPIQEPNVRSNGSHRGENRQLSISTCGKYDCAKTEEIIYSMAVWLIANNIIVQMNDYLATGEGTKNCCSAEAASEESLYQELSQGGYLDGTKPITAICYELGIDPVRMKKFIIWGQTSRRLNVVSRP